MTFSEALEQMKKGTRKTFARSGWNGKNQYVYLGKLTFDTEPCFVLHNAQRKLQPGWVPSMGDMLASDWEEYIPFKE